VLYPPCYPYKQTEVIENCLRSGNTWKVDIESAGEVLAIFNSKKAMQKGLKGSVLQRFCAWLANSDQRVLMKLALS
jgi:hypothetical protein